MANPIRLKGKLTTPKQTGKYYAIVRPAIANKKVSTGAYQAYITALSPSLYYPLNDKTGAAANEVMQSGTDGAYGAGCTIGQLQAPFTCVSFSGTTSYVDLLAAGAFETHFNEPEHSVILWIKPNFTWTDTTTRYMMNLSNGAGNAYYLNKDNNAAGQLVYLCQDGGTLKSVTQGPLNINTWHMIGYTHSDAANEFKAYYDGAQTGSTQTPVGTANATDLTKALLGAFTTSSGNPYIGWMAHFAVFGSALSDAQMLALYTNGGP